MYSKIAEMPRMPTLWNWPEPTNGDPFNIQQGRACTSPSIELSRRRMLEMYDWAQKLNRAWSGYPVGWDERDAKV